MRSFMKPLLAGWFHAHGDRILLRCSVNVTKCCSSGRKAQACGQTAEMALVEFERAAVHPRDALDDRQAEPEPAGVARRSEEHTSELQSLMRISYAVFCLKKKKDYKQHRQNNYTT